MGDFKKFVFEDFIFSRNLVLDKPGIIAGNLVNKFGKRGVQTRIVYLFENIFLDLYYNTKKEIGKEKTDILWYKIGKDFATRYFLFYAKEKFSTSLQKPALKYIFHFLSGAGLTFAEEIIGGSNENYFSVKGKNSLMVQKMNSGYFCSGILSGILSFVYDKNIEANCKDSFSETNNFVASKNFKNIYLPNKKDLEISEDYSNLNFNKMVNVEFFKKFSSLSDMMKFKKICFNKKENNWMFEDLALLPAEVGLMGIILNNYSNENLSKLFFNSCLKSSEKIFKKILGDKKNKKEKINYIANVFSSLGFGIPMVIEKEKKVIVKIFNPPISKYGSLDKTVIFNGAFNAAFEKKLNLVGSTPFKIVYSYD